MVWCVLHPIDTSRPVFFMGISIWYIAQRLDEFENLLVKFGSSSLQFVLDIDGVGSK